MHRSLTAALLLTPGLSLPRGEVGGFLSLSQIAEVQQQFHAAHSHLASAPQVIGQSIEGRNIMAQCIGARCPGLTSPTAQGSLPQSVAPSNERDGADGAAGAHSLPSATSDSSELLLTALHHAREPLGMMTSLALVESLLAAHDQGTAAATALLSRNQLWIVPCVNPDAYALNTQSDNWRAGRVMARKNRRPGCTAGNVHEDVGVDLNRNYDFAWDLDDLGSNPRSCAEDYRGAGAFSEPESRAVAELVASHNFSIALNFHSYGMFTNLPYAVQALGSPPAEDYSVFLHLGQAFSNLTGFGFGHPWAGGLYTVNGESSDWMYSKHGVFAMSPELGPEFDAPFEAGMYPSEASLPALMQQAATIAEFSAWASGSMLQPKMREAGKEDGGWEEGGGVAGQQQGLQLGPQGLSSGHLQLHLSSSGSSRPEESGRDESSSSSSTASLIALLDLPVENAGTRSSRGSVAATVLALEEGWMLHHPAFCSLPTAGGQQRQRDALSSSCAISITELLDAQALTALGLRCSVVDAADADVPGEELPAESEGQTDQSSSGVMMMSSSNSTLKLWECPLLAGSLPADISLEASAPAAASRYRRLESGVTATASAASAQALELQVRWEAPALASVVQHALQELWAQARAAAEAEKASSRSAEHGETEQDAGAGNAEAGEEQTREKTQNASAEHRAQSPRQQLRKEFSEWLLEHRAHFLRKARNVHGHHSAGSTRASQQNKQEQEKRVEQQQQEQQAEAADGTSSPGKKSAALQDVSSTAAGAGTAESVQDEGRQWAIHPHSKDELLVLLEFSSKAAAGGASAPDRIADASVAEGQEQQEQQLQQDVFAGGEAAEQLISFKGASAGYEDDIVLQAEQLQGLDQAEQLQGLDQAEAEAEAGIEAEGDSGIEFIAFDPSSYHGTVMEEGMQGVESVEHAGAWQDEEEWKEENEDDAYEIVDAPTEEDGLGVTEVIDGEEVQEDEEDSQRAGSLQAGEEIEDDNDDDVTEVLDLQALTSYLKQWLQSKKLSALDASKLLARASSAAGAAASSDGHSASSKSRRLQEGIRSTHSRRLQSSTVRTGRLFGASSSIAVHEEHAGTGGAEAAATEAGSSGPTGPSPVLPAQHSLSALSLPISITLPPSSLRSGHTLVQQCQQAAASKAATALLAAEQLGLTCTAVRSAGSAPLALLVLSDALDCSVYTVDCEGKTQLLTRSQSGCAVCALLRSQPETWRHLAAFQPKAHGSDAADAADSGEGSGAGSRADGEQDVLWRLSSSSTAFTAAMQVTALLVGIGLGIVAVRYSPGILDSLMGSRAAEATQQQTAAVDAQSGKAGKSEGQQKQDQQQSKTRKAAVMPEHSGSQTGMQLSGDDNGSGEETVLILGGTTATTSPREGKGAAGSTRAAVSSRQ